jgi:hypothetical protein
VTYSPDYSKPSDHEYQSLLNWQVILIGDIKSFSKSKKNLNEVAALKKDLAKVTSKIHYLEVVFQKKKAQCAGTQSA